MGSSPAPVKFSMFNPNVSKMPSIECDVPVARTPLSWTESFAVAYSFDDTRASATMNIENKSYQSDDLFCRMCSIPALVTFSLCNTNISYGP